MSDAPMKRYYIGEDVETLPREKLLEIIDYLAKELESAHKMHRHSIAILGSARAARSRL